jgi:hypothetical protein
MRDRSRRNPRRSRDRTSVPSSSIRPLLASVSRISVNARVVLPEPDSPTSPRISPRRRSRSTWSTARTGLGSTRLMRCQGDRRASKCFETARAVSTGRVSLAEYCSSRSPLTAACSTGDATSETRPRPASGPCRTQRTPCCVVTSIMGTGSAQASRRSGQRSAYEQPAGTSCRLGTRPGMPRSARWRSSYDGAVDSRARVYGWPGSANNAAAVADSTIWPAYITVTRSQV